jgi:Tannase and feruloyl esterase
MISQNVIRTLILASCIAAIRLDAVTCESLQNIKLPETAITLAATVAAGAFTPPQAEQPGLGAIAYQALPAFCRVTGVLKPSSDSDIRFEVWLPVSAWNGRFQGIGNGGFAGSINYSAGLANAVANGYAAASTDTGHEQQDIRADWALGHPEKITDFAYRAIHLTAVTGKALTESFYSRAPRHSYFSSCSNGGRQALMEAQRFPGDYDGIVAGAPANDWVDLFSGFIWNAQALSTTGGFIPPTKFSAIEAAVLAACDAQDGVTDGVIDDPSKCRFDPQKLICQGAEMASCLTAGQATTLARIYAGPSDSKGTALFPGFPPGGEAGAAGWPGWIAGAAPGKSAQFAFGTQFFSNFLFDDAAWDFHSFDFDRDVKLANSKLGAIMNATEANLKPFQSRGGKLILYHGWSDAAIPVPSTIGYYNRVVEIMGARQADDFVRLFLAPGMQHCAGGPGPNEFGQIAGKAGDAEHDINKAVERWVEEGEAPRKLIASKHKSDLNSASEVLRTRPLCAFPLVARHKGIGSTNDAANFACTKP